MLVAVGSENPVKVKAVEGAFHKVWPKAKIVAVAVESGVSHQPFGDLEAIRGAINRAKRALKKTKADFGVGLEGAVRKVGKYGHVESPWFAIIDKKGKIGLSGGGGFTLPQIVVEKLYQGKELGEVMDVLIGVPNSKQKMGAIGYLTNGLIDRKKYYEEYLIMALAKFFHPKLYEEEK